jgi:hypothetical protein
VSFLVDFPSIHPYILSTASSSSSKRCFTRILRLCQVFGLVLVVFSDSRSPFNPFSSSSLYPSVYFCSLGEYVSRPLLRENFYFPSSISSMPCQSLRTSFYSSISQSALSSVVRFLSPISFRPVSFPSFFLAVSTLYSSRYPQCLLYNIVDALFNPPPSPLSSFSVVSALYSSRYPQCLLYNIVDTL